MLSSLTSWVSLSLDDSGWFLSVESQTTESLPCSCMLSTSLGIMTFAMHGSDDGHRADIIGDAGEHGENTGLSFGDNSPILYLCASCRAERLWNIRSSAQSFTPPPRFNSAPFPPGCWARMGVTSKTELLITIQSESAVLCSATSSRVSIGHFCTRPVSWRSWVNIWQSYLPRDATRAVFYGCNETENGVWWYDDAWELRDHYMEILFQSLRTKKLGVILRTVTETSSLLY